MARVEGFDIGGYQRRLRLLREIISGERQADFARRLGIPAKRWNNYERGFPVSREIAFMIWHAFPGMSIEWIWFGATGNLSEYYRERIRAAEQLDRETEVNRKTLDRAKQRYAATVLKRKKALG